MSGLSSKHLTRHSYSYARGSRCNALDVLSHWYIVLLYCPLSTSSIVRSGAFWRKALHARKAAGWKYHAPGYDLRYPGTTVYKGCSQPRYRLTTCRSLPPKNVGSLVWAGLAGVLPPLGNKAQQHTWVSSWQMHGLLRHAGDLSISARSVFDCTR